MVFGGAWWFWDYLFSAINGNRAYSDQMTL